MEEKLNLGYYVKNGQAQVYSLNNPKKRNADDLSEEPATVPDDVLSGKREWNLTADLTDPRNKEGIIFLTEKE